MDRIVRSIACRWEAADHEAQNQGEVVNKTAEGTPIDDLLRHNITTYAANVKLKIEIGRKVGPVFSHLNRMAEVPIVAPDFRAPISPLQRALWGEEQYNLAASVEN
jgi:hypothetical protein